MPNVDIGAAISQSFRFFGTAWGRAWGALLIVVWVAAAVQAVIGLRPEWILFVWPLGGLLSAAASTAALGALYRLGVEGQHGDDPEFRPNAAGLQWGALEWRVLGANLLVGLIFGAVDVVIGLIWLVIFGLTLRGDPASVQAMQGTDSSASAAAFLHMLFGPAGLFSLAILLPTFCAQIFFGVRLSLYALLAADARSFSFGRAWSLTRGAVLAIIVASIVIGMAGFGIVLVVAFVGGVIVTLAQQGASAAGLWPVVIAQAVWVAFATPLFAGLQVYIYNNRRPADAGIAATFA
jgi:hypothetical protein